jgi:5-formyltetrahydrofolate cyclo-ligase
LNPEKIVKKELLDIIISPLLAFDRNGYRLGFGGGYYDKLFAECSCVKAGIGYSFQESENVPHDDFDQKLNIIITEKEIIRVKNE